MAYTGLPRWASGKELTWQIPWVGKIPWREDMATHSSIPWLPDVKSWLIRKDPDAGKDWRQEKELTEDKMVGCYHRPNGHEFEQTPGVNKGQGRTGSPWGHKELDMTE